MYMVDTWRWPKASERVIDELVVMPSRAAVWRSWQGDIEASILLVTADVGDLR
jgi:hypothetical protein